MLRRLLCFTLCLTLCASVLQAEIIPQAAPFKAYTILPDGTQIDTPDSATEVVDTWYDAFSNAPGPEGFFAFPAATGPVGFDDYETSTPAGEDFIELEEFNFVGGVQDAGGIATFEFFDTTSTFVDSFSVAFAGAGDFLYTITVAPGVVVPADGFVQMVVDAGTTGTFFLSDNVPAVGTTMDNPPNLLSPMGVPLNHPFRIFGNSVVPEPASFGFATLGLLGVLVLGRRR